jgi:hypothetical protein
VTAPRRTLRVVDLAEKRLHVFSYSVDQDAVNEILPAKTEFAFMAVVLHYPFKIISSPDILFL